MDNMPTDEDEWIEGTTATMTRAISNHTVVSHPDTSRTVIVKEVDGVIKMGRWEYTAKEIEAYVDILQRALTLLKVPD